ncbi:MAG: DUF4268 domain-containing protein [Ruminococcus sp.]|nr:DUF4268 domain-containing protein [Ruminococcus sp.]
MFLINKKNNTIQKIQSKTFHDLGFKEREHLQEWIAKNPECLGEEEFLIIQKEFDGFNDTNERLDLLALDKSGAIVVIENKLDDTGKDVVWQCMKYVSYCSTLSKQQIADIYQKYLDKQGKSEKAEDKLVEFYDDKPFNEITLNEHDQRMILVAGNFRKEVTSTVMWMLNHGIQVQCFKATPYKFGEELFLDIEQIIPVKEAEDYIIKMADKAKESQTVKENSRGIEELRKQYWTELLEQFGKVSKQFQNVNPSADHWLSGGSGVSGVPFSFIITKTYASVEISINHGDKEMNKHIFDILHAQKQDIEKSFGKPLLWQRLDDKKSCRIACRLEDVDGTNIEHWDKIKAFHCDVMPQFYNALKAPLIQAVKKAKI